ncbi:inheritance of peroxisomes protein 1-domain-containing protein [Nemania sp. NC0429]|nr:inheritance of peroxisomes protein 1-domain-containing protein [Nemania sp. NC0429]
MIAVSDDGSSVMDSPRLAAAQPGIVQSRRVLTAPVPASAPLQRTKSASSQADSSGSEEVVETLYSHPSVRIIAFTSGRQGFISSSGHDAPPGSLPPSSQLERTIAAGAFRIYRAPGSVAFLSCGSALQPILRRSQCWCIDEDNSRFVLQIRRPQYWRIEMPVTDPHDIFRAAVLRDVFDKILLFEKTECPFQRSFTVELPDPPETPVKKKAWTAEGKNLISNPFQSDLSPSADAPKAISRGEHVTTFYRGIPFAYNEEQNEYSLDAGDPFFKEDISESQMDKDADAPGSVGRIAFRAPTSHKNDLVVGTSERTAVNPWTSLEPLAQDPAVAPMSDVSSTGTDLLRSLEALTPDSSLNGASPEESGSRSLEAPGLDLSNEQAVAIKDQESYLRNSVDRFEEQEETGGDDHSWKEIELGARGHPAQMQEFAVLSSNSTTDPQNVSNQTQPECSLSDRQNNGIFESDNSNNEGDPPPLEGSGRVAPVNLARKRIPRMLSGRSFTSPPQLTSTASPLTSKKSVMEGGVIPPQPQQGPAQGQSPSASTDSFHSVQSWHSSITPPLVSPRPDASGMQDLSSETDNAGLLGPPSHVTFSSNHVATPEKTINVVSGSSVVSDSCGSAEPTPRPARFIKDERYPGPIESESGPGLSPLLTLKDKPRIRRRSHAGSLSMGRRALSPLPPASTIFSPSPRRTSRSRLAAARGLPTTIIQKTIEILLSPPSYLISLILKVAAKIAAGEWRGLVFGFGEAGEQIPVQWDYYSDDEFSDLSDSDDYALTTRSSGGGDSVPRTELRHRSRSARDDHDSCQVD